MEASDMVEYYGDSTMPMQLMNFAEQIYGRGGVGSTLVQGLHQAVHSLFRGLAHGAGR